MTDEMLEFVEFLVVVQLIHRQKSLRNYIHRFLYVTFHPWPRFAAPRQPQPPSPNLPPLCSGLDCAVIDLATFETVGRLDSAQTGLLSNKATTESVVPSISRQVILQGDPSDRIAGLD